MTDPDLLSETPEARLARSRAELLELLEPEQESGGPGASRGARRSGGFPRSLTMRLLTRGAGTGGLAALAVALFTLSPSRARHLLRYLPLNAIAKILIARLIDVRVRKS